MVNQNRGIAKPVVWISLIAVFLLAGLAYWWATRPTKKDDPLNLTAEEARQLVRLAEEVVANLENEQFRDGFDRAEDRLNQLKEKLPESEFVHRNQVIARLLLFKANKEEYSDKQEFIDQTTDLVESLIERSEKSFESYILAVRWRFLVNGDIDQTDVELLERAIEHAGSSPIPYYEFYESTVILDDDDIPGIVDKQKRYLAKAYELQPDNIKLAMLYLQQLAEQKSDRFATTWQEFKENLSPLIVSADLDYLVSSQQEFVAKIDDAVKDEKWTETMLNVRRLSNLVKRGEVLQIDLGRIQPHELEFLKLELDKEIVQLANGQSPGQSVATAVNFDVSQLLKMDQEIISVRVLDYDLDTSPDIAVLSASMFAIYKREEDGTWKVNCQVEMPENYSGFLAADLDHDKRILTTNRDQNDKGLSTIYSDPDFVFFGEDGVSLYENKQNPDGSRTFERVTAKEFSELSKISTAAFADIDHDKDLDLLVAGPNGIQLFLSRGNLSFYDFTKYSVFPSPERSVVSLDIVDIDRDIDIDIVVGFSDGKPGYLENIGHSQLRFRPFDDSFESIQQAKQVFAVEMDGKPSWDILADSSEGILLATSETTSSALRQKSTASVESVTRPIVAIADFNNDGSLDVVCADDAGTSVLPSKGTTFSEEPMEFSAIAAADPVDLNGDGKLDLVAVASDRKSVEFWNNQTESNNHWLQLSVVGRDSNFPKGRINNHAIGSFIEVKAGDYYFATTVKRPLLHFGLGPHQKVDIIRFLWTSGMPQSLVDLESGQNVYEEMFEKGSCPYIYTWNGSEFTFFSDCLWAAPLGLQYAPGKFIPCRNWEYLKIPGEILQPKDNQYVLQITEELREAAYFDLIKLYAIDHPAEVDIYTNEKVGPPFIAEHKIFTVKNPLMPVSATDKQGTDVLNLVAAQDGKYFRGFQERIGKGLAPLHYLELDFGELKEKLVGSTNMTLFLNGWIRPTDCSLNISYSQNPEEPSPLTPVVLVPDENGKWVKTIDPMGFPGGKPKTIAVDLTNAFRSHDYRIRIQTSHEIYWDQAFYTLGEEPAEITQTELNLSSADLHYRGFSKRFTQGPNAPEIYDYQKVNKTPRWPAMTGRFTRFGDVKELLTQSDDCSAVIGAGDEMTISFDAIPGPPPGWKRDFVIHLVGYDKDGDLNTVTGQSSEPLPFNAMKSYPYGIDEEFPSTDKHQRYLKKYQTRTQTWGSFWRRITETDAR